MTDKTHRLPKEETPASGERKPGPLGPFESGTELADRFEIVELLGSGGMGEVYEANDLVLNERVAIKVMYPQIALMKDAFLRFRREAKLARRVTHPNICRVYDLFRHSVPGGVDLDVVSMELLPGKSLREILTREGALPIAKALDLSRQIASGLHSAHRLGIVHRDLKPANIMLVKEGSHLRVAITDFGLARFHSQTTEESMLTGPGEMLGTPAYMSPEQIQGEPLSAATDIYSLGIIMFQMLSGILPFAGKNPVQIALSRLTESPRSLAELRPDLAPQIVFLIQKCMAVDPTERPQDCSEILEFLQEIHPPSRSFEDAELQLTSGTREKELQSQPVAAPRELPRELPTSPTSIPSSKPKGTHEKNRILLVAVCAILIALVALVAGRMNVLRKPAEPPSSVNLAQSESSSLEERVATLLSGQLRDMEAVNRVGPVPSDPANPAAVKNAAAHLAVFDGSAALAVLDEALVEYPKDPFLLSKKAEAQWRLGYDSKALETASTAVVLSGGLGADKPLLTDFLYYGLKGDWQRAIETLKGRTALGITDLETGLSMIEANWLLGRSDPMDEIFAILDKLPSADSDARVRLWRSRVTHSLGDYETQRQVAQDLVTRVDSQQHPFLAMEARMELIEALGRLGHLQEAESQVEEIAALATEAGDPLYQAHARRIRGRLLKRGGHSARAISNLREAAAIYEQLGARWGLCITYKLLGYSSSANLFRNPTTALETTIADDEKGVAACSQGGFREKEALVKLNLGQAFRDRGDFDEALQLIQESTDQLDALGNHRHQAMTRLNLALLLGRLGRIDETLAALQASEEWQRKLSDSGELAKILIVRAWGMISAGRLDEATKAILEAQELPGANARQLDLLELQGEVAWAEADATRLTGIAKQLQEVAQNLDRAEGIKIAHRLAAQATVLDGRVEQGLEQLARVDTARAHLTRAELLWDYGRTQAAQILLEESLPAIAALGERFKDWRVEILDSLLSADTEDTRTSSLERLRAVEHAAVRKGHLHAAVRARLAIGRLEGDREMLRAVEAECRRFGFLRLAARTHEWRSGSL